MKRRSFLKKAAAGVAATTIAAPAIAQSQPSIQWRMAASWPKSLDTIFGGAEHVARRVGEITDGKFQIRAFAAGEIVPALQVLDAVQAGTVELGHTALYYYYGKDAAFALACAVCFGPNTRQSNAWWYHGGGEKAFEPLGKDYGIKAILAGNTGCQMGGWFRKEIKSVADLQGVKMRIGGMAGLIMAKLGVVPQLIGGPDIYPALEKGTIDAAEWVGPYDDQKLGFNKVAPNYCYPGWWEGGPQLDFFVNTKAFDALSPEYKAVIEAASAVAHIDMQAKYDYRNPAALKQLVGSGTRLFRFPKEVMEAAFKASQEMYAELSSKNANWKKVYEDYAKVRADQNLWFRFAEAAFDDFMQTQKL
jgi:TRAP-type mannitol/chloroaromatic compound transport system substrate-binding protein